MKIVVDPPVNGPDEQLRAVAIVEVTAVPVGSGGVLAFGAKRPVAVVLGSGAAARVLDLRGTPVDPAVFGLSLDDTA